ncbi:hypothetical protein JX580_00440 [Thiomicrospira microaerophila]|uniref:DUF6447 family protein n=1 Tax=Thiomicrospira microaerophila TaxID=406020 RepID=UPI00200CD9F3|nr:DUF6447 family protein [Thiomicrospira microaerophila]UQB42418.1 hypothetical protein JX580_00440 [Thiomicrospira microaerophila]
MPKEKKQQLTINGKNYDIDSLSDQAKQQLMNLQFADGEIQQLKNKIALTNMARSSYLQVLNQHLPEKTAAANKKKDVITVDGKRYCLDDFNDEGKVQVQNLQVVAQLLDRLNSELAITQTARNGYYQILELSLTKTQ